MNTPEFDKTMRLVFIALSVTCLIWFFYQMAVSTNTELKGLVVAGLLSNYFISLEMYWRSK